MSFRDKVYEQKLFLGRQYDVYSYGGMYGWYLRNCLFIRVTRKGFNFLDLRTKQCIMKNHKYARNFGNKDLPSLHKMSYNGLFFYMPNEIQCKESEIQLNILNEYTI